MTRQGLKVEDISDIIFMFIQLLVANQSFAEVLACGATCPSQVPPILVKAMLGCALLGKHLLLR